MCILFSACRASVCLGVAGAAARRARSCRALLRGEGTGAEVAPGGLPHKSPFGYKTQQPSPGSCSSHMSPSQQQACRIPLAPQGHSPAAATTDPNPPQGTVPAIMPRQPRCPWQRRHDRRQRLDLAVGHQPLAVERL